MRTEEQFYRDLNKWADSVEEEFGGKVKRPPMAKAKQIDSKTRSIESELPKKNWRKQ